MKQIMDIVDEWGNKNIKIDTIMSGPMTRSTLELPTLQSNNETKNKNKNKFGANVLVRKRGCNVIMNRSYKSSVLTSHVPESKQKKSGVIPCTTTVNPRANQRASTTTNQKIKRTRMNSFIDNSNDFDDMFANDVSEIGSKHGSMNDRHRHNNTPVCDNDSRSQSAKKVMFENISCHGCTGCSNCKNCFNCTNCTGCNNCTDCVNCHGCRNCMNLKDRTNVHDVYNVQKSFSIDIMNTI